MAADDLTKPLGLAPRRKLPRVRLILLAGPAVIVCVGVAIVLLLRAGDSGERTNVPAPVPAFAPTGKS